ncbi:MAG TPA: type IV pilus secretin PilQ [Polyangiaceae bacterium]|jgi:type IV pilus assembly protein PilQ|nr:type IV pilus secretin PilQ [Polyangiaceae bacterium]
MTRSRRTRAARRSISLLALAACLGSVPAHAEPLSRFATSMHVQGDAASTLLVVDFTSPPTYSARYVKAQRRLIVDINGSGVKGAPPALSAPKGLVAGAMLQEFKSGNSSTTRLIVSLDKDAPYAVSSVGNSLQVRLGQGDTTAKANAPASPVKRAGAAGDKVNSRVRTVNFSKHGVEERVSIELGSACRYEQRRVNPTTTRLELQNTELPSELQRALDVRAFGGGVSLVSTYATNDGRVILEVEHGERVESRIERRGSVLLWSFFEGTVPSSVSGLALDGKVARKTRTIFTEPGLLQPESDEANRLVVAEDDSAQPTQDLAADTKSAATADESEAHVVTRTPEQAAAYEGTGNGPGHYTGRRVDLDFKDADIHNVLRLLADTGRVNIVAADNVAGSVTIRMKNVPWDQALDVVLQAKSLGMDRRGNIIRVAPQADLEKEREMQIARRQQELQLAPLETRLIPISYAQAAQIQARAHDLLSARGSIAVDARTNVLIVRDVAGNLDQIEELTRSLDTQTPQVLIEARIVEATSRYLHSVGIQWGGDASFSASSGNPTGLAFPSSVGLAGGATDANTPTAGLSPFQARVANPNFAVNLPATVGQGSGGALGLTLGSVDSNFNLALRLSAAEASGMLRILSSPRVLTLDNTEARISQGTLIPFSQVSAQGVQTTFQEAKLQLLVQPHVTADGSVSMHVKINRDEPDFNQTSPRGDPTILKREAETELLVMDGHTAVIGGIFTRNTGRNVDQVPFFGDIPLLGLLFQKRTASDTRGELVIFLTPRIVNRAEALGR